MLVSAVTSGEILTTEIHGPCVVNVDGFDLRFLQNKGKYSLAVPPELSIVRSCIPEPEESMILLNEAAQTTIQLYFSSSEGWHDFRRAVYRNRAVFIGTGIEDDLHIRSDFLHESCIRIDPQYSAVRADPEIPVSLNGIRIRENAVFQDGDVLDCLNLRILLHHTFFWFSTCLNVSSILPDAEATMTAVFDAAPKKTAETLPLLQMPQQPEPVALSGVKEIAEREHRPAILSIGPALTMAGASLLTGILMMWNGIRSGSSAVSLLPSVLLPATMMISALLWTPLSLKYEKRSIARRKEQSILDYLEELKRLQKTVAQQKLFYADELNRLFPENGRAMFRLPEHPEHIYLRAGTETAENLVVVKELVPSEDPRIREAAEHLKTIAAQGMQIPVLLDLKEISCIRITGRNAVQNIRSMFLRAAEMKLSLLLLFDEDKVREIYDLLAHPALYVDNGVRLASGKPEDDLMILSGLEENKDYVLFCLRRKGPPETVKTDPRILSVITVCDSCTSLILDTGNGQGKIIDPDTGTSRNWSADLAGNILPEFCPHPVPEACRKNSFLSLYGAERAEDLQIRKRWESFQNGRLPALLGLQEDGQKIVLDLSETEDGPHGLIAGTTGSGKSELLITLILSLAVQCPPEKVQFVLIDFKGGGACSAIAQGTDPLPHVAGMLTNLDEDTIRRAQLSFTCECRRREQLFERLHQSTGHPVRNLKEYSMYRFLDADLPVLAELVIVVDEFAQLKSECPDFLKELLMISRIGRSLGIHLILATQKPGGVVSDEIRANTRFRICLRVSERSDSLEVLHSPEGAFLKNPGEFLLEKQNQIIRGQCAYANAEVSEKLQIALLNLPHTEAFFMPSERSDSRTELLTVLEEITRCTALKARARPIWHSALGKLHWKDVPRMAAGAFARTDDILRCRQDWLLFHPEDGPAGFFSGSIRTRHEIQKTMLRLFLHSMHLPVVRIADKGDYGLCGVSEIEEQDTLRIRGMLRMLKESAEKRENNALILICDVPSFLKAEEENTVLLQQMCAEWEKLKAVPVLIASDSSTLSWRLLNLVRQRFCMGDCVKTEILSLLSHAPMLKPYAAECGYTVQEDECVLFRMICTEAENFSDVTEPERILPVPEIPEMPMCSGQGCGTVIGYSLEDAYPVRIRRNLLVLSDTGKESDPLFEILNSHVSCFREFPPASCDPYVLFLTFPEYEKEQMMNRWKGDVMIFGESAGKQYYYPCGRMRFGEGEGWWISEERKEKILLVRQ